MDLSAVEDSKRVTIVCGLLLATFCLVMWFRLVLDQRLTNVTRTMTGEMALVEKVDSIMDNLDRLSMNQRAFLLTGDEGFSEQVAESVMAVDNDLEALKQISQNRRPLRRQFGRLSHQVTWVLKSIAKTFEVRQRSGAGVAIELLDHDDAVEDAKQDALSLKRLATDGMFERVRTGREIGSIFEELF